MLVLVRIKYSLGLNNLHFIVTTLKVLILVQRLLWYVT